MFLNIFYNSIEAARKTYTFAHNTFSITRFTFAGSQNSPMRETHNRISETITSHFRWFNHYFLECNVARKKRKKERTREKERDRQTVSWTIFIRNCQLTIGLAHFTVYSIRLIDLENDEFAKNKNRKKQSNKSAKNISRCCIAAVCSCMIDRLFLFGLKFISGQLIIFH